ncbi:MAG TPA: septum formation initiator family protein [Gemmatimonadales bacterium]|nr:septum formation initiator family protein [Gemmatimonadales bacterium]
MRLRELVTIRRVIVAIILLALLFGVEGGEYGTRDWLALRTQARQERELVAELTGDVDSLAVVLRRLERDPATQEKVAREEFGMVREGEFLVRLIPGGEGER